MSWFRSLPLGLTAAAFLVPLSGAGASPASPLHVQDPFPAVSGQTLTNRTVGLPAATAGTPGAVIFSFSRNAGADVRQWNQHLSRDFPATVPEYTVIMLEAIPKLFRAMAMSGLRSGMPAAMQDHAIVLDHDEDLWKQRLTASDDSRAYVLLLKPDGHILAANSGAFTDTDYARLKTLLEGVLRGRP